MRRSLCLLCAMGLSGAAQADGLPWGREMAGDMELPRPFGIGIDFFTMDQDYVVESLAFVLPGVPPIPPNLVRVKNQVDHHDLKFDAWLLPFLNVFAIYGQVDARTDVDLSAVPAAALGLPPLGMVPVRYDGDVWGGGLTLAIGGERWFASLTGTWTRTSLSGDFDSDVSSRSWQPRVGLVRGPWSAWIGGQYIAVEENHQGTFTLIPGLPPVPFVVELRERNAWNTVVGARHAFASGFEISGEYGFSGRDTWLINGTWRFGGD